MVVACNEQKDECVVMLRRDFDQIARWAFLWEQEGKAMCLALGIQKKDCGVAE